MAKLKEEKEKKWSHIFAYAHAPGAKKPIRIDQCRKSFLARLFGRDPFNQNSDRSDREKRTTSKGGPVFPKLFRLDRTDPLSFGPKFPEILVEWIAPKGFKNNCHARSLHVKILDSAPFTVREGKNKLVYEIILLNKILRNHLLSENVKIMAKYETERLISVHSETTHFSKK